MKFSVPTSWGGEFIDSIVPFKEQINYVYGKFKTDIVGGGRSSFFVPFVSKKRFIKHINSLTKEGFIFNYLLNSTSVSDIEFSLSKIKKLKALLALLSDCGIFYFTVASPYLLECIKNSYPQANVNISTFAGINSLAKASDWESKGADTITLSLCARDLGLLKEIKANLRCKIQLIANQTCFYHCPFMSDHAHYLSQTSKKIFLGRLPIIDFYLLNCLLLKLKNKIEIIKAPWIRPEDVHYYEGIGIDSIKIAGRNLSSDRIIAILKSYIYREHKGNLLALFPDSLEYVPNKHKNKQGINKIMLIYQVLLNSSLSDLLLIRKIQKEINFLYRNIKVYIDNKALDGFMEFFIKNNGCNQDCSRCGYCQKISDSVVKISPPNYIKYLTGLDDLLSRVNKSPHERI